MVALMDLRPGANTVSKEARQSMNWSYHIKHVLAGSAVIGVNRRSTGTPWRHPKGTPLIGVLCW
jgi:hypothetical protein